MTDHRAASTVYWDVDTQNDFISSDGLLAVPGAENIRSTLARMTQYAHDHGIRIVATADDHDLGHAEISSHPDWKTTFPPHCMRGTVGQEKIIETTLRSPLTIHAVPNDPDVLSTKILAHAGDILLLKPGTDVFRWNPNAATVLKALAPTRVVVYGVATDVCVVAAVDGIIRLRPDLDLVVVSDAVSALDEQGGRTLLARWAASGVDVCSSTELFA